jgi:anti-sigma factor RsiW
MNSPRDIPCLTAQDLLSASFDGVLTADEQTSLDGHLLGCPACVTRMQNTMTLRSALRGIAQREAETELAPLMSDTVARLASATRERVLAAETAQRLRKTS